MGSSIATDKPFFYVISDHLKILFADDDPILREFAQVHLASETVEVLTAADGVEVIALLEQAVPDLILLDLEMPHMDGFEVLKYLADRQLRVPVIVVTGREDVAAIDAAYEAGATSFVVKPLNWRQLSYQIRYVHRTAVNQQSLARSLAVAQGRLETLERQFESLAEAAARAPASDLSGAVAGLMRP